MKLFSKFSSLFMLFTLFTFAAFAQGAVIQNSASTTASVTVPESITVGLTGGPFIIPTVLLTNSNTATVNVSYNLIPSNHLSGIQYVAYFSGTLTDATGDTIPSANVAQGGTVNGHASGSICGNAASNVVGFAGGVANQFCWSGIALTQALLVTTPSGSWSDPLNFQLQNVLPTKAGVYTTTVFVVYVAL